MDPVSRPRVKICCIQDVAEAWTAIEHGASALGLVSAMPSGPGVISEQTIEQIGAVTPPSISSFLLTSLRDPSSIIDQQRRLRPNTLQLCDQIETAHYQILREALPGVALVQVVHVLGDGSVEEALTVAPHVDAILLDSGNPSAAVKQLGGTGRRHDWGVSRRIREAVSVPVFLAGGLNAGNVGQAVRQVAPFGVDVCSGVRTQERLDPDKLASFFAAVAGAERNERIRPNGPARGRAAGP